MTTKLRILCLHGFTSNGAVHAHQMRHITTQLPEYEFLFPDGPHAVDIATQMDMSKPPNQAWSDVVMGIGPTAGHRAWWYARDGAFGNSTTGGFWGLEESLRSLGDFLREKGPVHAITGFSQGACFAGMLVALLQERGAESSLKQHLGDVTGTEARAGVIFSGFRARFSQYDELYEGGIQVPTLHCIGEKDDAVRGERSEELIKVCEGAEELTHFGGHNIPKSKEDHMRIMKFLRRWVAGAEGERVPASL